MRRLDALLRDDAGLHAISLIKHHPRDFSHRQLLVEIERGDLSPLEIVPSGSRRVRRRRRIITQQL